MGRGVSRRRLLTALAAATVASGTLSGSTSAQRDTAGGGREGERGFAPPTHGYGFRNWSSADQYFEAPPSPTRSEIRERVRTAWDERAQRALGLDVTGLSRAMVDSIAAQLRLAVVQRAGTNGHCYGMVLTAQRYFENPAAIPVDRRLASEIESPIVPIEEPAAPVYEEIVQRQADQFLKFRAFVGRRVILYRDWIDTAAVLRDVRDVIETFGTAAVILFNGSMFSHQVLAYGFRERDDGVVIPIYDPNRPAPAYRRNAPALRFERDGASVSMRPYGKYTGVLFSRYDRIEAATDRDRAGPIDHVTVDRERLRESLFPHALIVATTEDIDLAVAGPADRRVRRLRGEYTDVTRGEYSRVCSRYGADPGTYRISVFGERRTDYELTATVTDREGALVDETRTASIGPGRVHEYDLEIPDDGDGELTRVRAGARRLRLLGAGAAGIAAGAVGYRTARRLRNRGGGDRD